MSYERTPVHLTPEPRVLHKTCTKMTVIGKNKVVPENMKGSRLVAHLYS